MNQDQFNNLNPDAGVSDAPDSNSFGSNDHLGFFISDKMNGWIRLHRSLDSHWISPFYKKRQLTYYEAWIDMLFLANFQSRKILWNGQLLKVERGSFISSLCKLSERWCWKMGYTRHFITLLKNDEMITTESHSKYTQITICNYDKYQLPEQTESKQKANKTQTKSKQKATTKELKKDNEVNNNNPLPFNEKFKMAWEEWEEHCKQRRHTLTSSTKIRQLKKIQKWAAGNEEVACAILETSMDNGWIGLFEPKQQPKQPIQYEKVFTGENLSLQRIHNES